MISEGEIEGFPNDKDEDIFFNGLKGEAAGVDIVQFADGSQNSVAITNIKNQGFHMQVGASFPVGGGDYDDNIPLTESPNTVVIRSFNQPYADKIRVRIMQEPYYQTRNFTSKKGTVNLHIFRTPVIRMTQAVLTTLLDTGLKFLLMALSFLLLKSQLQVRFYIINLLFTKSMFQVEPNLSP